MEFAVFVVAAVIVLAGAFGVILSSNPVHAALSLVATLFGVAVLFVAQEADFLAVVQVIVYAGAIVVLFLFVIMLLGVDKSEDLTTDPLVGQRGAAIVFGIAGLTLTLVAVLGSTDGAPPGMKSVVQAIDEEVPNVVALAELLFTRYLFAFEVTSVLLVIAIVGAIVLARRPPPEAFELTDEERQAAEPKEEVA